MGLNFFETNIDVVLGESALSSIERYTSFEQPYRFEEISNCCDHMVRSSGVVVA